MMQGKIINQGLLGSLGTVPRKQASFAPGVASGSSGREEAVAAGDLALPSGFNSYPNPKALRTSILRLLSPKTILYRAFGLF